MIGYIGDYSTGEVHYFNDIRECIGLGPCTKQRKPVPVPASVEVRK